MNNGKQVTSTALEVQTPALEVQTTALEVQTTSLEDALRRGDGENAHAAAQAERAAERVRRRIAQEGLADVSYDAVDSPFGPLLLAATKRGVVRLAFPEENVEEVLDGLAQRLSPRIVQSSAPLERARHELAEYFAGQRRSFGLTLDWALVGTFGQRVLRAASAIPYGGVLSYAQVASEAGSPRGSRAAGSALGANPIPIVIPCHRVLRKGGALGGYAGGLERKRWLLELEGAQASFGSI